MFLYHGSNIAVNKPEIREPNRGLDFGKGFYATSSQEQAERFSLEVCNRARKLGPERVGLPTVSVYEFDNAFINDLSVKVFNEPNEAWLFYVKDQRRQEYSGVI